ncbi:MAG: FAD-dependent oxidoreductase [Bryobacterales bacterium]|nr:FAD-dependent oxidoreductase [Bryobacterales bacterium]
MTKPSILTVDDDPNVLRSVERDLRKRYGQEYRILRAASGEEALDALRKLKLRNEPVALLIADQRMPGMDGVTFLAGALQVFPDARRALLTAYADTDAAIKAINDVKIDHYLLKPWDPPEERLYPVLDDLLEDWRGNYRPPFEGIRIVGHRWSPQTHQLKDFLGRNHIPFQWVDVEAQDGDVRRYLEALGPTDELPVAVFPDGSRLPTPTPEQVAEKVGLRVRAESPLYDLTIVGAGPAGLAAAVYGASEGLCTLLVDREGPGGQAGMSSKIENYLGFPSGVSGADLTRRAVTQAKRLGAEILAPQEVVSLRAEGNYRILQFRDGSEVTSFSVLIATGLAWRKLDAPGIEKLTGAGIYYGAAMTEAVSCKDEEVFVVGGANSAGQGAMHFSKYARKVTMLVRGESLAATMSQYLIDQIEATPNIEVLPHTEIAEAHGDAKLTGLTLANRKTGERAEVPANALFIFIGAQPCTSWLKGVVPMDEHGYILAGPQLMRDGKRPARWTPDRDPFLLETGLPGVFVAGDTRCGSVKRVASSVGEGSITVAMVHQYLSKVR